MFDSVPDDATAYVMGAYIFFLLMILIYIGILGLKFPRISRDIGELTDEVTADRALSPEGQPVANQPGEPEAGQSRV